MMPEPLLHTWYTYEDAIAAFPHFMPPKTYCENQFAVLSSDVLCFATLGKPENEPHLSSPIDFVFRPRTLHSPWIPKAVTDVYYWHGLVKKRRQKHIFLRIPSDERYLYAGKAHLGSYSSPIQGERISQISHLSAHFTLEHRLPLEHWRHLGGYQGWKVILNDADHTIQSGDREAFAALLNSVREREFSHISITRYEGDTLDLFTNSTRGWLMYLRSPDDSGLYLDDFEFSDAPSTIESFRCDCGIDLEFPTEQTLSRDTAIETAFEFFEKGELPRPADWREG